MSIMQIKKDQENIVTLIFDRPEKAVNLLDDQFLVEFQETLNKLTKDPQVQGLILASAKKDFIAGADTKFLQGLKNYQETYEASMAAHKMLRQMETWGKPVVAALQGNCLGGGLEVALACHYRVGLDTGKGKLGFPEVTLGMLPGAGGTQRTPRLLPLQKSLELLGEGRLVSYSQAKEIGLIHELAKNPEELLEMAKDWIRKNPKASQPWDRDNFRLPGGSIQSPQSLKIFFAATSLVQQKTGGHYPAPKEILQTVYEGLQLPFNRAIEREAKGFAWLVQSAVSKSLVRTQFFGIQECNKGPANLADIPKDKITKVGILGAGMMGQGIALVTAQAGYPVVLKDMTMEMATKGKAYAEKVLTAEVTKGKLTNEKKEQILALITPTTDPASIQNCDLVIEAVVEDRKLKFQVTQESEKVMASKGIFASNTSTLPITGLAEASKRPENFIGLHFFSPVEKMPLVEIISGEKTSDQTRARVLDYVRSLQKTPIYVNDGRGFYTSRVFMTYVGEGMTMLHEGIMPSLIDNSGKMAGMPVGPLAVADEVGLNLVSHIINQTEADGGQSFIPQAIIKVTDLMVKTLGRLGRKSQHGFYEYPADGKKFIWPELSQHFSTRSLKDQPSTELVQKRLMYIQALETMRCLQENILLSARDADVGAILGWGFPPYTGGPLSMIENLGLPRFIQECRELEKLFGKRFSVPQLLLDMEKKGQKFYERD